MEGYNIIIADDHKLFRKGIARLLSTMKEINHVWEVGDGVELIESVKINKPHLVILDLELPKMDGFEAAKIMVKKFPQVRILVLTMYDNSDFINYLWDLGVHGYLIKNSNVDEMYRAIISVIENDFYKNEMIENALRERKDIAKATALNQEPIHLTPREKEVLQYLVEEKTSKEIGELLGVSNRTVERIRNDLMARYKKKSVVGLVKFALKNKLIYV